MSGEQASGAPLGERLVAFAGRIWPRFLLVNVLVMLVPIAGLEFARIYERELLGALERDMRNQAALVREFVEDDLSRGVEVGGGGHGAALREAARGTRTRIRLLDPAGAVLVDSHEEGAPEGPEPKPPRILGSYAWTTPSSPRDRTNAELRERSEPAEGGGGSAQGERSRSEPRGPHEAPMVSASEPRGARPPFLSRAYDVARSVTRHADAFPPVGDRTEVKAALAGKDSAYSRVARNPRAVFLFVATPVHEAGGAKVAGAVYVTRSTAPVLVELYGIRSRLFKLLAVALALGLLTSLVLALSISRPLSRLSAAARRIAAGERGVPLPVGGSGEIKELGESFRTMTDELDARLKYISDFSADVAHEFKSPLTAIRGAAELLAEGAHEDPEARARFLRNILLDTERLDRLVSRLLLLGRIEASAEAMTLVDLRSLVERLAARVAQRRRVNVDYAASRTWVRGREPDLETALGNLLENAERYGPEGEPIAVSARDDGAGIVVTVTDRGPGIPEARLQKVFDRFYTTEGDRGGTGLGLAIVDSVARAHGGRVRVESAVGSGSTFTLWLPVAHGAG